MAHSEPYTNASFYKRYKRYYTYLEPIISDPLIRSYFTIVASLLLVTFFLLFALSPTINTILGLLRKIEDQKIVLSALDDKINNLIVAQENYGQIESLLPLLDTALPANSTPETALQTILTTTKASNVNVVSLEFAQLPLSTDVPDVVTKESVANASRFEKLGLKEIHFSTGVSADETKIKEWVRLLENSPRIIKIHSLSFSRSLSDQSAVASGSGLNVNVRGEAFYTNEKEGTN